jgi:hypothetical protein
VLDLGPFGTAAIALVLGLAHGLFWHGSALGKRLLMKSPTRIIRPAIALVVVVLLVAGSRIRETSPTYAAIGEGGLGLKFALKLARRATDRDGDGYSALFGGGDCDDSRADVYPGAEDIPGDGIDQDCEGGDAPLVAEASADQDETPAAAMKPGPASPASLAATSSSSPSMPPEPIGSASPATVDRLATRSRPTSTGLPAGARTFAGFGPRRPTRRAPSPRS